MKKRGSIQEFKLATGEFSYGARLKIMGKTISKRGFKTRVEAEKCLEEMIKAHPIIPVRPGSRKAQSNSLTGVRGISFNKNSNKFYVRLSENGKHFAGGAYSTLEEAIKAKESLAKAIIEGTTDKWQYEHISREIKPGEKFNELTVIRYTGITCNGSKLYKTQCSCGKIYYATASALKGGNLKSCGHLKMKKAKNNVKQGQAKIRKINTKYGGTSPAMLGNNPTKANTSGYRNIYVQNDGRYLVLVAFKKKINYGGKYAKLSDAIEARDRLQEELWGNTLEKWKGDPLNNGKEN
ncbi:AP2 domain-containing protein [Liquorilactobacillus nagelii]|uniref:AP2 domain-containing protein n=1 Tax=Liquorilactobacillus nagelii TaxID=82688 RepID=UPI000708C7D0|nr:AP2 domain-containing protein [Liquorilactobacillus nagelii]QYH53421.1 hypothetical protein G6O73_01395 [Liquorilactobacillus nagelii DSM 13675]